MFEIEKDDDDAFVAISRPSLFRLDKEPTLYQAHSISLSCDHNGEEQCVHLSYSIYGVEGLKTLCLREPDLPRFEWVGTDLPEIKGDSK
jgi:hypothetical protein